MSRPQSNVRRSGEPPRWPRLVRREYFRNRVVAAIALLLTWVFLWGTFSVLSFVTGLIVAVIILVVLPLPPVKFDGRIRPVGMAKFVVKFVYDLLVASAQISWLAFRIGRQPRGAIVAVQLRVVSDLNVTLVAEALSLIPGSLILEADPDTGVLYIHMIGTETVEEVEAYKRNVLRLEKRLIRALGSDAELALVEDSSEPEPPHRPMSKAKRQLRAQAAAGRKVDKPSREQLRKRRQRKPKRRPDEDGEVTP
ncbi:Na+/H+ antiporter subunit E [Natronoglycomyces albus]|uniref:Na+/H+ antiporter subunit E n=1 Tax=Natronoglycomyces albus TaxID=2811108 RepID=A0A895XPJ8_9ACTN|nr:Na+/H+ antiporter subunit E [Natronoglycomyces albus]QSB05299.1 Na+/H+ antiporter subunit E [Natronoglycomyces albus]